MTTPTPSPATGELKAKLGDGEFYAQGDRFELVFRPGGGNYAGGDIVVAKMACGDTAYWLPGLVAKLLNDALRTPPATGEGEAKLAADIMTAMRRDNIGASSDAETQDEWEAFVLTPMIQSSRASPDQDVERLREALKAIADDRYNFNSIEPLIERLHTWQQAARQALTTQKDHRK